jgi:uroporphyrinogen decarboxylase
MTQRENWLSLMGRKGYEFAPVFFFLCPHQVEEYKKKTGSNLPFEDYFEFPNRMIPVVQPAERKSPVDWKKFYSYDLDPEVKFNGWGVAHEPGGEAAKHMTRMRHPMAEFTSLEQFETYPWPDYSKINVEPLRRSCDQIKSAGYLPEAHMAMTVWETSWYLRSMEELMVDMLSEDEKAVFVLDKVTEISCMKIAAYARAGVDHIHIGDDVGMQKSLMMSEEMYRLWLKPRLAKVIRTAKAVNPDLMISYHTCGYVKPLIADFIEAGIDILNPVQPECMDFEDVHRDFGDRVSFWGTIGTQQLIPYGTPEEIKKQVWKNLDIAGSKGGLWCTPTHILEPEVPWENIMAYVEACREYKSNP